jgi:ribose transport system substrate-binding protein
MIDSHPKRDRTDPKAPLITALLLTDGQDFQRAQEQSASDVCKRVGFQLEVAFADNNPTMQIRQALEYIERPLNIRPLAMVVELASTPDAFTDVARSALTARIGWVELSSRSSTVETLRREFPGQLFASVNVDEDAIGALHAAQCRTLLPKGGTILYVEGPSVSAIVKSRRRGLKKGLEGSSITIAQTISADWTEEGAMSATVAWLRQGSNNRFCPDLVCSQNDAMAIGVQRGAKAQHATWANVPFLGCDGAPDVGQRYVREGILATTIIKPVTAGPAVEWIVRRMRGEKVPRHTVLSPTSVPTIEALARRT